VAGRLWGGAVSKRLSWPSIRLEFGARVLDSGLQNRELIGMVLGGPVDGGHPGEGAWPGRLTVGKN
jgi:hypothetical protein